MSLHAQVFAPMANMSPEQLQVLSKSQVPLPLSIPKTNYLQALMNEKIDTTAQAHLENYATATTYTVEYTTAKQETRTLTGRPFVFQTTGFGSEAVAENAGVSDIPAHVQKILKPWIFLPKENS